jgi:predicted porin
MNKKIVALAVAGALGAPLMAQAQTANVVLYGSVRAALISTSVSGGGRGTGVDNISSRLGFRASDSLGGGLTGFAHVEFGISTDNIGGGNGANATREAWVGISGGFGELKMGGGLTPWDDVMGMNHNSIVGGFNNINAIYFGNGFGNYNGCVGTAFDARYGNSISYKTPAIGPVSVRTQYGFLNEATTGRKCSGWDTAFIGGFGPVQAGLAYAKHNNFQAAAGALEHDADNFLVTVKGNFGLIDANIGLENAKYSANWNSSSAKYRGLVAGVGFNLGASKVGLDYSTRNNGIAAQAAAGSALHNTRVVSNVNGGGKLITLYANHNFSKRTIGYAWVGRDNPETGADRTQIAVALRHNF